MIFLPVLMALAVPQAPIDKGARAFYFAYGNCVVKGQEKRAADAIQSNVDDTRFLKRYPTLADGGCLKMRQGTWGFFSVQADKVRYAVADALVRTEFPIPGNLNFSSVAPLDHGPALTEPEKVRPNGKPVNKDIYAKAVAEYRLKFGARLWSKIGECVVRQEPLTAHALLMSQPNTSEEDAQFSKLKAALATCLPESDALQLQELPLRGTIAVNFYRLAKGAAR